MSSKVIHSPNPQPILRTNTPGRTRKPTLVVPTARGVVPTTRVVVPPNRGNLTTHRQQGVPHGTLGLRSAHQPRRLVRARTGALSCHSSTRSAARATPSARAKKLSPVQNEPSACCASTVRGGKKAGFGLRSSLSPVVCIQKCIFNVRRDTRPALIPSKSLPIHALIRSTRCCPPRKKLPTPAFAAGRLFRAQGSGFACQG